MSELADIDVDLDALAPKPLRVRLAGDVYKLPGDLKVPLMLKLKSAEGRPFDGDYVGGLYGDVLGLFQVHQPELEDIPIGLQQLVRAIPALYLQAAVDDATEAD